MEAKGHFDQIAVEYDKWKEKNWYYYDNLKTLYRELIPSNSRVLEVGCGTGDLLVEVNSSKGVGINIRSEMIKFAQTKHKNNPNIQFRTSPLEDFFPSNDFDYIFLADVIEHLDSVNSAMNHLRRIANPKVRVIISMANPLWEPILLILEKLKLKMPEGPHQRISLTQLETMLKENNFQIIDKGFRCLLPLYLPFFSNLINQHFRKVPIIRKFGLITYFVCVVNHW